MIKPKTIRYIVYACLILAILVSIEIYNTAFSGLSEDDAVKQGADMRPQIAALMLWSLLILISFIPGAARLDVPVRQMYWPALLMAWAVASSCWSDDPLATMPKSVALLITSIAAWRVSALVTVKEMFSCLYYSLAFLLLASMALVFLVPSVGVVQREWQHVGNWQGVFASKQGLGLASAVFLGINLLRLSDRRTLADAALAVVGLACLFGSASRGAGAITLVAVGALVVARPYQRMSFIVTSVFWIDLVLATANIAYFAMTGRQSIEIMDYDLNFTERTYIWQYALGLWTHRPLMGYGLNGFWTNPNIYYAYLRLHGWVLDNYHDGYVAIIMETGLIGFSLFALTAGQLAMKVRRLLIVLPRSQRLDIEMGIVFLTMFFTINLTETYFLRSTNFLSVLFAFLLVKIFSSKATQTAAVAVRRQLPAMT